MTKVIIKSLVLGFIIGTVLSFERAEMTQDAAKRKAYLTFVVVGAGPTGVEMAGAIAEK